MKYDSWASFLAHTFASPCFGCKFKAKVATLPPLLRIWCDPKVESNMFRRKLLKDWGHTHLPYCG
jgi:hypothetical protein